MALAVLKAALCSRLRTDSLHFLAQRLQLCRVRHRLRHRGREQLGQVRDYYDGVNGVFGRVRQ